jgi:hypothetical protein
LLGNNAADDNASANIARWRLNEDLQHAFLGRRIRGANVKATEGQGS